MKVFKITEKDLQSIAAVLGEFPAKHVIGTIDMLRNLTEIETDEVVEAEE